MTVLEILKILVKEKAVIVIEDYNRIGEKTQSEIPFRVLGDGRASSIQFNEKRANLNLVVAYPVEVDVESEKIRTMWKKSYCVVKDGQLNMTSIKFATSKEVPFGELTDDPYINIAYFQDICPTIEKEELITQLIEQSKLTLKVKEEKTRTDREQYLSKFGIYPSGFSPRTKSLGKDKVEIETLIPEYKAETSKDNNFLELLFIYRVTIGEPFSRENFILKKQKIKV